jgi:hypothetical protein
MTKQQPERQNTQRYRYRATASVSRPLMRRRKASSRNEREHVQLSSREKSRAEPQVATERKAASERKVTMPDEAVQPLSWAERRSRYRQPRSGQEVATKRKVTMPHEAVQPLSWAERRSLHRQPQAAQVTRHRLVQRTLSQTGRPAPVGQRRTSRPLPRQRSGSLKPVHRRQRRGFWGRLLGFLTLLAVIIGGVSVALTSPTFHIQHLVISGTHNQGLISYIQHMGIQGQDIFLLNQSALAARLETLPLVASASLVVQLPSSVMVNIQEREPVLLWRNGQSILGIDQSGMVIAPLSQLSSAKNLPIVIDKRSHVQIHPGTQFKAEDITFVEQLFQQLPEIQGVAPFTLLYVDWITLGGQAIPANEGGEGSYTVVSADGWLAYLGNASNSNSLTNRLQELQQILSIARKKGLSLATIDLRFGLRPTYTLKS